MTLVKTSYIFLYRESFTAFPDPVKYHYSLFPIGTVMGNEGTNKNNNNNKNYNENYICGNSSEAIPLLDSFTAASCVSTTLALWKY